MKTIKILALISVLTIGITQSAFALWWNPFTWFQKKVVPMQQLQQNSAMSALIVRGDQTHKASSSTGLNTKEEKQKEPKVILNTQNADQMVKTVSVIGAVYNSVYIKDNKSFIFIDKNNKKWTVDYQKADFSERSYSFGKVSHTDGLLKTQLGDWLKIQKNVGDPDDIVGAPGLITITGIISNEGILLASDIIIDGQ